MMSREAPFGRLWHNRDFSSVIYIGVLWHDDLFKLGHTRCDSLGRRQSQLRRHDAAAVGALYTSSFSS